MIDGTRETTVRHPRTDLVDGCLVVAVDSLIYRVSCPACRWRLDVAGRSAAIADARRHSCGRSR